MTVPGVNLICAATFIAAVGDIRRFSSRGSWSPTSAWTRRSASPASEPARSGRITKRGSASARWALVEAAWSVVLQPGPLHAFYTAHPRAPRARQGDRRDRPQAGGPVLVHAHPRRGLRPPATVADQEEAAPARDHRRRAERKGKPAGCGAPTQRSAKPRSELAAQAEASYKRIVRDWKAAAEEGRGRERDTGARINRPSRAKPRGRLRAPDACASTRHRSRPTDNLAPLTDVDHHDAVTTRAQNPPQPPDQDRRRPAGLTGADLRPSKTPPRPIHRPKSPQIPPTRRRPLFFIGRPRKKQAAVSRDAFLRADAGVATAGHCGAVPGPPSFGDPYAMRAGKA